MSWIAFTLVAVSVVGAVTILLLQARRDRRQALFLLGFVLVLAVLPLVGLQLPFSNTGTPRGNNDDEPWFLLVLYAFLLAGMLAQYGHASLSRPRRYRPKFDLGLFLAPIFTSPIVFIPLFAAVQAAGIDLYRADSARVMLYLVAFENGFFWKVIFDQRRQLAAQQDEQ